jgi:hypothetical protein
MSDYRKYPLAETPYISHEVPWEELGEVEKSDALARFNGTFLTGKKMEDYVYFCAPGGGLIGRKLK